MTLKRLRTNRFNAPERVTIVVTSERSKRVAMDMYMEELVSRTGPARPWRFLEVYNFKTRKDKGLKFSPNTNPHIYYSISKFQINISKTFVDIDIQIIKILTIFWPSIGWFFNYTHQWYRLTMVIYKNTNNCIVLIAKYKD